jgi:hypothetical protein
VAAPGRDLLGHGRFVRPHQTLSEKAFLQPEFSAEMFVVFAKVHPFLKQIRQRMRNPEFMANVQRVILNSKEARERLREASRRNSSLGKAGVSLSR